MSKTFTQGPWHVGGAGYQKFVYGTGKYLVADCDKIPVRYTEEMESNAQLISAAPDLLAACEQALLLCPYVPACISTERMLTEATAKAKGSK